MGAESGLRSSRLADVTERAAVPSAHRQRRRPCLSAMRPPISHKHRHTKPATICQIRTLRRVSESVKKKTFGHRGLAPQEKAGEAHLQASPVELAVKQSSLRQSQGSIHSRWNPPERPVYQRDRPRNAQRRSSRISWLGGVGLRTGQKGRQPMMGLGYELTPGAWVNAANVNVANLDLFSDSIISPFGADDAPERGTPTARTLAP
jgi:hypothetical protein